LGLFCQGILIVDICLGFMELGIDYVVGAIGGSSVEGSGLDGGLLLNEKGGDRPMGWQITGISRGSQRPQRQRPRLRIPMPRPQAGNSGPVQRPAYDSNGGTQRGIADITDYGNVGFVADQGYFSF